MKNKVIFAFLLLIIFVNLIWFSFSLFKTLTVKVPGEGGTYIEALVGQPNYLNPLIDQNSSIVKLVFNGLFDYDANGELVNDLVEKYERSENGKEYTIFLRQNVKWHDGEKFLADDVIFTINLIKNKDYGNFGIDNNLRIAFDNVDKLEKVNDFTLKFVLKEEQFDFLHNLTIGILPQHAWSTVQPNSFLTSKLNQSPIGTGAFEFVSRDETSDSISSYTLRSYGEYHKGRPLIKKVIFKFYENRESIIKAYNDGEVLAVNVYTKGLTDSVKKEGVQKNIVTYPHYFSVFLNQNKSVPLAFDEVRDSLALATNREEIAQQVFGDLVVPMTSPFMKDSFGFSEKNQQKSFNLEEANKILDEKGWKKGDDEIRKKGDTRLEFSLHINSGQSFYLEVAKILQNQWKKVGADVKIVEHEKEDLDKNVIETRDFDALLDRHFTRFSDPDLFSLWHSRAGFNFAKVKNNDLDLALENLKREKNLDKRKDLYEKVQEKIKAENLTIFLFSPRFVFIHDDELQGVTTKKVNNVNGYYSDIQNWYLKEKYIWKK